MRVRDDGSLDLRPAARINTRLAIASALLGAALLAGGVALEAAYGWSGVSQSILVEVGAALLLVAGLAVVERRLIEEVAELAKDPICTRAEPPAAIHSETSSNGAPLFGCDHRPQHLWARDTGAVWDT